MKKFWTLPLAFIVMAALPACGGGGGSSESEGGTEEPPQFSVSTTVLDFSARIGESTPEAQNFTVSLIDPDSEQPHFNWDGVAITDVFPYWGYTSADVTVRVPDPDTLGIGTHTGTITVETYDQTRIVTVNYQVLGGLPKVTNISPYLVTADASGTVIVSGSGFVGGAVPSVTFGSTAATAVEVIDDSTLHVTYPAMAVGNYDVSVVGDTAFDSSLSLRVVAAATHSDTVIPTTGMRNKLVYDPVRNAIYAVDRDVDEIERYTYDAATLTWNRDALALAGVWDIDISTDGNTLLAVGDNVIYTLDPDASTLAATTFVTHDFKDSISTCKYYFDGIRVTSNGSAILSTGLRSCSGYSDDFWLDIATGTITEPGFDLGILKVSADRHRIYEDYFYDWQYLDYTAQQFVDDGSDNDVVSLDGDASHYVGLIGVNYGVFDTKTHTKLGSFPSDTYNKTLSMSYDGSSIYKYNWTTNELTRYELASKDAAEVFQATATHTLYGDIGSGGIMLSDDGNTLFIKGANGIAVVDLTTW